MFILPHFLTPVYRPGGSGESNNTMCTDRVNETVCAEGGSELADAARYLPAFCINNNRAQFIVYKCIYIIIGCKFENDIN